MARRRTKILATIGPASREPAVLDQLFAVGLDAVRLNFSHGTREWHAETYRRVREAAARSGREVAVLQDLQGPKIRIGRLRGEMTVAPRLARNGSSSSSSGACVETSWSSSSGHASLPAPPTRSSW